ELAGDRRLEPPRALVARVVPVLAEHRAERLALVHRDHRERARLAGERVEAHRAARRVWQRCHRWRSYASAAPASAAASSQICPSANVWITVAGQSGSNPSAARTRAAATRFPSP